MEATDAAVECIGKVELNGLEATDAAVECIGKVEVVKEVVWSTVEVRSKMGAAGAEKSELEKVLRLELEVIRVESMAAGSKIAGGLTAEVVDAEVAADAVGAVVCIGVTKTGILEVEADRGRRLYWFEGFIEKNCE